MTGEDATRQLQVPTQEMRSESDTDELVPEGAMQTRPRMRKIGIAVLAFGLVAMVVGVVVFRQGRDCSKMLGTPEEKVELDQLDPPSRMAAVSKKLDTVVTKSAAERLVKNAMKRGGETVNQKWEETKGHHAGQAPMRKLPNSFIGNDHTDPEFHMKDDKKGDAQVRELPNSFIAGQAGEDAGTAMCVFDVMQAFTSVIGLGNGINAVVRTCPAPRDGVSEITCEVNAPMIATWTGNIAAQLSLAASHCAKTANIDAVCAAGVTGVVAVLGEIAAGASLAVPTCSPEAQRTGGASLNLPTTKISELGDQTLDGKYTGRRLLTPRDGGEARRLLIGQGAVGNGVMCTVDVSMIAENAADMGLAINQAVNNQFDYCSSKSWKIKVPSKPGGNPKPAGSLLKSLCTVDVGGAIAYLSQVITFISLAILHCKDFLDIKALCSASSAAVVTGAAAIAPYGAAIQAGCVKDGQAKVATGGGRRLPGLQELFPAGQLKKGKPDSIARMNEVMKDLKATMVKMGHNVSAIPDFPPPPTHADDLDDLLNLMEPPMFEKTSFRGSGPFEESCQ